MILAVAGLVGQREVATNIRLAKRYSSKCAAAKKTT